MVTVYVTVLKTLKKSYGKETCLTLNVPHLFYQKISFAQTLTNILQNVKLTLRKASPYLLVKDGFLTGTKGNQDVGVLYSLNCKAMSRRITYWVCSFVPR